MLKPVAIMMGLAIVAAAATSADAAMYAVTIDNLVAGGPATGQPFSPPVAVVHDGSYAEFEPGTFASPGLALCAREGDPSMLSSEASAASGVMSVVVGTGPYFDTQTITVMGNPGDLLSIAWMLGRTNDCFSGIHDVLLPATGEMDLYTGAWDAGVEVNTGLAMDIPFYGGHGVGPDEHNPIADITSFTVHDDPTYGKISWQFPPVTHVHISVMGPSASEPTVWGELKTLFR